MSKNLHIVHVMLSLDVGGLERNVLNQVRQGPRLGQRITIICLERPGTMAEQVRSAGAKVICLDKKPGIRLGLIRRLAAVFEELAADVVHTHQIATLFYSGPAAKLAGVRLVVHTEHGKEKYAQRFQTRMLGRIAGRFTSTFYCLTEDMAASVRANRIVPDRKIRVIFNGIDTSQYGQPCDAQAVRQSLGIPANAKVIGTVGRLTEVKRQDVLIRGFARAKAQVPALHLLLVGDGPLRQELEDLAKTLGVAESVHFAGYQPTSAPFLAVMNIFAMTSRSEGMPQAGIEACVTGLPMVASRIGGLPELVSDGETGLLFPVADDAALGAAIVQLLSEPEKSQRMGETAKRRAIARFDIARMAAEYQSHFLDALHINGRREGSEHAFAIQ
jgi:glycosyltransferase involved in cell wall biosynthesis